MIKRYFNSYAENTYKNNEVLAYCKGQFGSFEVVAWQQQFEVFYRPFGKRYGYLLGVYEDLKYAVNVMKSQNETEMAKRFIAMTI